MQVKIGNDGTDNNVKIQVCSDSNNVCCEKRLHHLLKDDWKKNNVENWSAKDFEECANTQFKVT